MAKIVLRDLAPPVKELEQGEMKSIFGGIIILDGTLTTTNNTYIEPGDIFGDPLFRAVDSIFSMGTKI